MGIMGRDAKGRREVFGSRSLARGLSNFFDPLNMAAAQAAMSGDSATAARVALAMQERRQNRREARELAYQREQLGNILQKDERLGGEGFTEGQRALAMAHPESFFTNWNTRYRTDEVTQGNSRPNIGGGGQVRDNWRAPQTVQNGDDLQFIEYQEGQGGPQMPSGRGPAAPPAPIGPRGLLGSSRGLPMPQLPPPQIPAPAASPPSAMVQVGAARPAGFPTVQTVPMRTDAEQRAATLGLEPGTPAYETFLRDSYLDAQGPTAVQLTREGHAVTRRGQDIGERSNIRSNDTSRRGQDIGERNNTRSNETTRRGQDIGSETTRQSGAYGQGQRRNLTGPRYRQPDGRVIQFDTVSGTYVTIGTAGR